MHRARLPQAAESRWWNRDWKHRRKLTVKNNLPGELKGGHPVLFEIDVDYLGIRERSRKDFADLALVRDGRPVPFAIVPGKAPGRHTLWFRTAADLAAGAVDGSYALYYGHPEASAAAAGRESIFDFFEDFSGPEGFRDKFVADPSVRLSVENGALCLRDLDADRTEEMPARVTLKGLPAGGGFALELDLEIESGGTAVLGFSAGFSVKEPAGDEPGLARRIDELVRQLGDTGWEAREKATLELLKIGKPALDKLLRATRSGDAEVKWRAIQAVRQIRESAPAPVATTGVLIGDARYGPLAITHAIGKERGRSSYRVPWPVRLHLTLQRDADGDVTVAWSTGLAQRGQLAGALEAVHLAFFKSGAGAPAALRIDNVILRRHVDEESRPTFTLESEETRP